MSDTPRNQDDSRNQDASSDQGEFRDPTAPSWSQPDHGAEEGRQAGVSGEPDTSREPDAGERDSGVTWSDTQAFSPGGTQQLPLEPPAGGTPPPPPGYGQTGETGQGGQAGSGLGQGGYPPSPYAQQGVPQNPYAQAPPAQPSPYAPSGDQPGQQYPYGQGQPPYGYGQAPSPYAARRQTNGSALVLVIVSGLSTLFGCLFAIPAVIFGILAMVKQTEDPAESAKFTRWGWIAYAVAVGLVVILGIGAIALFATSASTSY